MIKLAVWIYLALQPASSEPEIDQILVDNLCRMAKSIDVASAKLHAESALSAGEATGLGPELLLAMAYTESHFDPTATSRVEGSKRVTGRWASMEEVGIGPRFCGVLQTQAGHDWATCLAMRDLIVGYVVGAIELRRWLRYTRGDLVMALSGYGCGFAGFENGCRNYAARVLARKRQLARGTS